MRKIMNEPTGFVDETIDSILAALPELVAVGGDRRVLARAGERPAGRVGIVTGGGSGHLPLFLGYVGEGLCTAVAIGNVFSSPSVDQMHASTMAADAGAGVLYLYGNYGGDVMNFDLAGDLAADDGVETATVLGVDDIMSAPADRRDERRGVAGIVFAYKCAGAAADRGDDLAEVARIARAAVDATRTAGVGLSATILPTTGRSSFDLDAGDMEIGIGIHGEPGIERTALTSARDIARRLMAPIVDELGLGPADRVALLVNGLGSTPLEELYILRGEAAVLLEAAGAEIARTFVGEYVTSLEMAGASLSVMRLDDELLELLDADAASPFVSFRRRG